MLIILEGPDGAGKTTLANQFKDYKYVHHGLYRDDNQFELIERYAQSIHKAEDNTIIDRCYLSELVYGRVKRGKSRLGDTGLLLLQALCKANDVREIICLPPKDVVMANWSEKKDDYIKFLSEERAIWELYGSILDNSREYIWYDYTKHTLPELMRKLK